MLTNKYILFALSGLASVLTVLASLQWSTIVSPTETGYIVTAINAVLAVLAAVMPPAGQKDITSTGGTFFTHT